MRPGVASSFQQNLPSIGLFRTANILHRSCLNPVALDPAALNLDDFDPVDLDFF